jgi:hypothetical protein
MSLAHAFFVMLAFFGAIAFVGFWLDFIAFHLKHRHIARNVRHHHVEIGFRSNPPQEKR